MNINKSKIFGNILLVIILLIITLPISVAFGGSTGKHAEVDVSAADAITLNIPVGQLRISGMTEPTIQAEAMITCNQHDGIKCNDDTLEDIAWSSSIEGGHAQLSLTPAKADQYDDLSIVVNVSVPEGKTLTVNLDYGDLELQGTNACLDVTVKAGNVKLGLREKSLASVDLKATIGDVSLTTATGTIHGKRSKIVGARLEWDEGVGVCQAHAKVSAGNIALTLK